MRKTNMAATGPTMGKLGPYTQVAIAVGGILSTSLAMAGTADAVGNADSSSPTVLKEVVVTATKRTESIQNVPVSISALDDRSLSRLDIHSFDDFAAQFPSVSFTNTAPGFDKVYMRGVATGLEGDHSGSQPAVGVYLDEQPITTITGPLDVHIYDVARVEVLAGPQGTLFGAASEAGTIRIITNKPDPKETSSGYEIEANHVEHGDFGGTVEGFVNLPLGEKAAVRLVGWDEHDAGFIDNVPGTLTYPVPSPDGITINNSAVAARHYNTVDTVGGRAALKILLGDNWTVTPGIMGQRQKTRGSFGYDPGIGYLDIEHFEPESNADDWYQAALTVEGRIFNFDLVYAGSYLHRHVDNHLDYTDYSTAYDAMYGQYFTNDNGQIIDPSQRIDNVGEYRMQSHELRLLSPKRWPVRFVGGLFYEQNTHDILQNYTVADLATSISVTGWPRTWWLTDQTRTDSDRAAFGELSADLTHRLTATAGIRVFRSSEELVGFYGFGAGNAFAPNGPGENAIDPGTGERICNYAIRYHGAPCENLSAGTSTSGSTYRGNLSYKLADGKMIYGTVSRGFRPGGINRGGDQLVYQPDYLTNYEVGWKTTWRAGRLRWNGAVYYDPWRNFQAPLPVQFGLSQIVNLSQAVAKGVETDFDWIAVPGLTLSLAYAYTDAYLTKDFQGLTSEVLAPSGEQLPITPKEKGSATVRYEHSLGYALAYVQGNVVAQDRSWTDIRALERSEIGPQPGYALFNFRLGFTLGSSNVELFVDNAFDRHAQLTRDTECDPGTCQRIYIVPARPRTVGMRLSQEF